MDTEGLMEKIVEKVIETLKKREKQALVVFTGGAIGFNESVHQLNKLQTNGWTLKVVLSKSAEHIFTADLIQKKLSLNQVYLERNNEGVQSLAKDSSLLIIPTLTMNTLAKVALGIADNLTTNLVAHFILNGLPIITAKDACLPDHPARLEFVTGPIPKRYLQLFHHYVDVLSGYGIRMVRAEEIFITVQKIAQNRQVNEIQTNSSIQKNNFTRKKVITRTDILAAKEAGNCIYVEPQTIITPLAIDVADSVGVKIVKIGE